MTEDSARSLGDWLRQRREELGLTLVQAEQDTRIRRRYLEALETEEYAALPDPVVGRGVLRNYAGYLGLDPQEAISRYSQHVSPPDVVGLRVDESSPFGSGPFVPLALHDMPSRRSRRMWLAGAAIALVAALAVAGWWFYPRWSDGIARLWPFASPAQATPTKRLPVAELSTATQTATAAPSATARAQATTSQEPPTLTPRPSARPTRTASPSPTQPVYTGIFLELTFIDRSWIRITVDGVRREQATLEAGTYRSYYGDQRIEVSLGNAGGVELTLNGQKLGALGEVGQVVDQVFEKAGEGIALGTLTPGPTGSVTVQPTATVTGTQPLTVTATLTTTVEATPAITVTATP